MENKAAKRKYMNSKTSVWWDMDSCPVPADYNASLVGPSIHLALEKLGYRGPITITAVGKLKRISQDILRAISSTGIIVKYDPRSRYINLSEELESWQRSNPAPATIMIITGSLVLELVSPDLRSLQKKGYNILLAYRSAQAKKVSKLVASAEWRWKNLLKDAMSSDNKLEARRQVLQEECSETCERDPFTCRLCKSTWQSLEEFTTHLEGLDHEVNKFKSQVDTDYLDSITQDVMEKELEEMKSFLNEEVAYNRRKKVTTTLLANKIKWEELKKKLKEREQLSSQVQQHEQEKELERLKKRKLVNDGAKSSNRKKARMASFVNAKKMERKKLQKKKKKLKKKGQLASQGQQHE